MIMEQLTQGQVYAQLGDKMILTHTDFKRL